MNPIDCTFRLLAQAFSLITGIAPDDYYDYHHKLCESQVYDYWKFPSLQIGKTEGDYIELDCCHPDCPFREYLRTERWRWRWKPPNFDTERRRNEMTTTPEDIKEWKENSRRYEFLSWLAFQGRLEEFVHLKELDRLGTYLGMDKVIDQEIENRSHYNNWKRKM